MTPDRTPEPDPAAPGAPAAHGPRPADEARRMLRAAREQAAGAGAAGPTPPARPVRRRRASPAAVPPELRRTFDPGPPRRPGRAAASGPAAARDTGAPGGGPGDGTGSGSGDGTGTGSGPAGGEDAFAATWWGRAWLRALAEVADPARLARGRSYAESGRVDTVSVTPGLLLAYVHGGRPRPYRTLLRMPVLDAEDWDRFLDEAVRTPAWAAALLDRELPAALAEPVPLLPRPGELRAECGCPDGARPCKHAAALCHRAARIIDEDPFALLLLRGRGERDLLDALTRRSAARSTTDGPGESALPAVRAREAVLTAQAAPLPPPFPPPARPGTPPAYPVADGGPDPLALDQLATEAAARAHALLTTGEDPLAGLDPWRDAVRIAAARPGSGLTAPGRALYARLAEAVGRSPAELGRAVAAWRQGGPDALTVLDVFWDPPAGRFDRARPALLAAGHPPFRPRRNTLTHPSGERQLRLGRDGLWYAYESEPGQDDWWPTGTADLDPVRALALPGADDPPAGTGAP